MADRMEKPDVVMVDDLDVKNPSSDNEKAPQARTIDNIRVLGLTDDDVEFYDNFTPEQRKTVIKKVDRRLVPMLAILYLISHLDRANIGNAKIEGLATDLNLVGNQYNIVLSLFFIPYILLEIPSNILLKKFKRPSVYLGILVTIWGIIMTLHGVVDGFGGLLAVRMLLGVFEAGFYPGAVYLCTFWYMPKDLATRIAYFYCTSALSGAFSGLLAAGIAQMDGVGGYEGWRWIFILEGIATVVMGVLCFFLLIDSPSLSGRWLAPEEIRFLELQSFIKQGGRFAEETSGRKLAWHDMKMVLCNWRLYMQAYILLCISACSYGTKFTLPSIVKAMGYTNTHAQLMTVPVYICGGISSICFAKLSDHFHWRMPFVAIPLTLIAVGYSIIMSFHGDMTGRHTGPGYFALILTSKKTRISVMFLLIDTTRSALVFFHVFLRGVLGSREKEGPSFTFVTHLQMSLLGMVKFVPRHGGFRNTDFASIYRNEVEVGDGIRKSGVPRSDIFITGKLWNTKHAPEDVEKGLDRSLKCLGIEYLDLFLMHWPCAFKSGDDWFPIDSDGVFELADIDPAETYKAMEKLIDTGKVRAIGVSNFTQQRLEDLMSKTSIIPAVNQIEAHPYLQQPELFDYCKSKGIQLAAYSPLGNNQTGEPRTVDDPLVAELAKKLGLDIGQVCYSWGVQRGSVVLPKSVTPSRIKSNREVTELPQDAFEQLNGLERNKRYNWQTRWGYDIFQELGEEEVKKAAKEAGPENKDKFDVTDFKKAGGKPLAWHGTADELIPYKGSVDYFNRVREEDPDATEYYRFFEAPGVQHFKGGLVWFPRGAFDALVKWVERGEAPETPYAETVGTKKKSAVELYAYPRKLTYQGGDASLASSYGCK
ncbi:hypothetical protein ACHAP5_012198 [Fusarium lateritium]